MTRWQRGVISLNLGLGLSYIALWIIAGAQDLFWRADFTAFYTGGALVRDGYGRQLYDRALQTQYQQQILEGRSFKEGLLPYNYPPHAVLPFVLLASMPLTSAFRIWTLVQIALLVWLMHLLYQFAQTWQPPERWLLLTTALALPSLARTFLVGAFSLWSLICLLQFYISLKKAGETQAGLWFALGTVKPQNLLLPGVLILSARRWRTLASLLLIGAGMIVFCSAWLGWENWTSFLYTLRETSRYYGVLGVNPRGMYNLKGVLTLLLGNEQGLMINQISLGALLLVALVTFLIWRGPWRPNAPDFELRMALTLLLGLLFSPHLNPQDGLLLVAPAALFYAYLRQRQLPRRAYAVFVLSCPLLFLIAEAALGGKLGIRIPTLAMVVLAIWMGAAFYSEQRVALQSRPVQAG